MTRSGTDLAVQVEADEADLEQLDELTRQLREELLQLEVERVEAPRGGPAPPGTRAGEVAAVGALLVGLAGKVGLLPVVVDTIRGWLTRARQPGVVKLEMDGDVLEVTGASSAQQQQLIEAWLARHTATQPDAEAVAEEGAAGS